MNNNEKALTDIARRFFGIKTLESRNADHLDFFEGSVWDLKAALEAAYKLGSQEQKKKISKQASSEDNDHWPHDAGPWGE